MTSDSSAQCLRDRILSFLNHPLTEIGGAALNAFLSLPSVENWKPVNVYGLEVTKALDIGLPFSFLVGNDSASSHRQEVGAKVGRNEEPPEILMSEVHAGALLSNWGASVEFVPRQAYPTPDIHVKWSEGAAVDVEVVRGKRRHLHKAIQERLNDFCGVLRPGDRDFNFIGFIADASNEGDLNSMFEAALGLLSGDVAEVPNKWCIRAVALEKRDEVVSGRSAELFAPFWWSLDEPSYFAISTLIGGTENPTTVYIHSLIPDASYRNPIERKATSGQRRLDFPYIIGFDVSELPRAHERILNQLHSDFETWSHVSAVMLFEPRFWYGAERKEYIVSIHSNPYASVGLPEQLASLASGNRFSVEFMLSTSSA